MANPRTWIFDVEIEFPTIEGETRRQANERLKLEMMKVIKSMGGLYAIRPEKPNEQLDWAGGRPRR